MADNVFTKRYKGPTGGDGTAPYAVDMHKKATLQEFIDAVLEDRTEWGHITVYAGEGGTRLPGTNFKDGKADIPKKVKKYLSSIVASAGASGGWTNMNYVVIVAR